MTSAHPLIKALARVTFVPGTAYKRYVRQVSAWPDSRVLTEKSERFAWKIAYHYRRQLPRELANEAMDRHNTSAVMDTPISPTPLRFGDLDSIALKQRSH